MTFKFKGTTLVVVRRSWSTFFLILINNLVVPEFC